MDGYSGTIACDAGDGRYSASLSYAVEAGRVKSFAWSSALASSARGCQVAFAQQQPMQGGIKLAEGRCAVTLRDLGDDLIKVTAEGCSALCGPDAYLEPMLVERRGNCRLLRPEAPR